MTYKLINLYSGQVIEIYPEIITLPPEDFDPNEWILYTDIENLYENT